MYIYSYVLSSVMTMLRDEYRDQTTARMKREVGTSKFLHGADLDKLANFAQDRVAWVALVNHIKHRTKLKWVLGTEGRREERSRSPLESHTGHTSKSRRCQSATQRSSSSQTTGVW